MNFLPPQVCGRSWLGWKFGVKTFLHKLFDFLYLKSPSSSLFRYFFKLLTCVNCIYWISVHWSWKFFLCLLEHYLWGISEQYIRICFPCRFLEGCGKGAGFVISLVVINILTVFKSIIPIYSCCLLFVLVLTFEEEVHKGPPQNLVYKYYRQQFISSAM